MAAQLVLVTGTSGFVGTEVALEFLKNGFRVRGTVRSEEKAKKWEEKHGNFEGRLEWSIVKDIATEGAFDEAIKGVDFLAHTASPFHFNVTDNERDMLIPALEGTRQALRAAQDEPSVKRVVVTSSLAAVLDLDKLGPEAKYDHTSWNSSTYEQAKNAPVGGEAAVFVYFAAKKLAEQEAWKIADEEKTKWKLTTICPPSLSGPPHQPLDSLAALNTSIAAIWDVVDKKEISQVLFPVYTDNRDVAKLHVRAVTKEIAAGKRYLCVAGRYQNEQVAFLGRKHFPQHASRFPPVKPEEAVDRAEQLFKTDPSLVLRELLPEGWTPFEESMKDTLAELFRLEEELKK